MASGAKRPAILKERQLKARTLRFSLHAEMIPLLQRVSGNKSKRTAKTLAKEGPISLLVIALDKGGTLEEHSVDGPFTVQCLLGRARLQLGSKREDISVGDLLVVDTAVPHSVEATEACVLLLTISRGPAK